VRVLGVDFGSRRTGLALSDPMGVTCRPLDVITSATQEGTVTAVVSAAHREGVEKIVVGLPRPLSGGSNAQLERTEAFTRALQAAAGLPVSTWDERFTSKMAESGRSRNKGTDAIAACYMLQSYLDSRSDSRS
jgi:putative holliday junction resolvase